MPGETILHIGYDPLLTELRQQVLERAGYCVITLLGNAAVRAEAKMVAADAIVIGSGGDYQERLEIALWLREHVRGVPVLVMSAAADEEFPPGISKFLADTARDWLIAVDSIIEKARRDTRARAAHK